MPPFTLSNRNSRFRTLILQLVGEVVEKVFVRIHSRDIVHLEKGSIFRLGTGLSPSLTVGRVVVVVIIDDVVVVVVVVDVIIFVVVVVAVVLLLL